MCLTILTLRGQIPGAESPFQVIDIRGERLSETAERNGGAVCGWAAVLATLGNLAGYLLTTVLPVERLLDSEKEIKSMICHFQIVLSVLKSV